MAKTSRRRVLIVGGGIAGLSSAIALRGLGWDIVGVEKAPGFTTDGTGINLTPNALYAFGQLGLADAIRAAGYSQRKCVLRAVDGSVLGEFDVSDWTSDRIQIHRGRLHEILLHSLADVEYKLRTVVSNFNLEASGVRARLSDGTEATFDLVVAADGYRSDLRTRIRPETGVVYTGSNVWRVICNAPLRDGWTWQLGSGRWLHAIRVGDGEVYATADIRSSQPLEPMPPGELTRRFSDFGPPLRTFLPFLDGPAARFDAVYEASGDTWVLGRVVFVGDAAHALPPILGQGSAMAAEDAIVLAGELASSDSIDNALGGYARRRQSRLIALRDLAHLISQELGAGFGGSVENVAALLRMQDEAVRPLP